MEKLITYNEAKNFLKIYISGMGEIQETNFFDLLSNTKQLEEIEKYVGTETRRSHNALAYYINNVTSSTGSTFRLGNFACDISYLVSERLGKDYSDIIGIIINNLRYFDYLKDGEVVECEDEVYQERVFLFKHRLSQRFECAYGKSFSRSRWID